MLRISKLADYATVMMSHLALMPERSLSAAQLAQEAHLAVPTVRKILKILAQAGLVLADRGVRGGYQLARTPVSISLADVVAAIDGIPTLTECGSGNTCSQDGICAIKGNWRLINRVIMSALQEISLADMCKPLNEHPVVLAGRLKAMAL